MLEIIQVAANGPEDIPIGIIDVPAIGKDLGPLADLLLDPAILKIVHSGTQDVEILTNSLGQMPTSLYDTQVAAAFAGYSLQTGYGALVQSLLTVRLSKEEGFSDWSRRPLTQSMLDYAANDVRYLHALHDRLSALLAKRNRTPWASEQMENILTHAAEPTRPEELWRRVGGRNALEAKGLAVLRELAIWRDEEAKRRDKPRRSVIKDEALVDIAKRTPQTADAVLHLRSAPQNLGEKTATTIAERVRQALSTPRDQWPVPEASIALDEQAAALVELLSAVVRIRAAEEYLPPSLLASGDDLRQLVNGRKNGDGEVEELLTGWRGELVGKQLQSVLSGEIAVSWDAKRRRMRLLRVQTTGPDTPKSDAS